MTATQWTNSTSNSTSWTNGSVSSTAFSGREVANLGVIMDDTAYIMDDSVCTMDDMKLNIGYAPATTWTNI